MRKFIFVLFFSLLVLTACNEEKDPVIEAFKSERIEIIRIDSSNSMTIHGLKPNNFYRLDNGQHMVVYDFGSKENQELGYKDYKKQREVYSNFDPPIYQANKHLVIIYGGVAPEERIQKALNRIQ